MRDRSEPVGFEIQRSFDGGETWFPFADVRYQRVDHHCGAIDLNR